MTPDENPRVVNAAQMGWSVQCCGERMAFDRPAVMGILNVTPDSFYDGGRFMRRDRAVDRALQMVSEGADILDIGGESTRPGARDVAVQEELERVLPIIEAVRHRVDVPLSVDTSKPRVMEEATAAGAVMVNDVRALRTAGALETVRDLGVAVCLMHMQGTPRTMQAQPRYDDVVAEVREFLASRIHACLEAGIPRERLVADPGFGFGKNLEQNLRLLRGLRGLGGLGVPVMAGLSRKSTVGRITGSDKDDRVYGSVAFALAAVREGASVVRVHDVKATVDALKVWQVVYG